MMNDKHLDSQENKLKEIKRAPELRFKGFSDDWEQRKLGEVIDISSASRVHKNEWVKNGVRFFRSSDVMATHNGNNNEKAYISVELYNRLSLKSGKVKIDDILVTGGGTVGMPFIITTDEPLYFKDADLIWLKNSEVIDGNFLYNFFISPIFKKYIKSVSHIGTISHYTIEQAKETPIKLPSFTEQQKIGVIFKQLNNTLTLHQRKLDKLKQLKQGYLQQMFPKSGESVPKIRFANFEADWEQCKLRNYLSIPEKLKVSVKSKDDLMTVKLNLGGVESGISRETLEFGSTIYYKRRAGQFIYGKQNFFNGSMAIIPPNLDGKATSGDVPSLDINGINPNYLYTYVSRVSYWKSKKSKATGTGSKRIHENTLQDFDFHVPSEIEQIQIEVFFKQLDDIITLHQEKLLQLKKCKKAFLQKMFL
ncbi:MAG: restriction endonuclease subunit S [Lactococcus petauri]